MYKIHGTISAYEVAVYFKKNPINSVKRQLTK